MNPEPTPEQAEAIRLLKTATLHVPGEEPPPEPQGSSERSRLATCSLPVLSAEAICRELQNREQSHRGAALQRGERFSANGDMRHTYAADAYKAAVAMLRREMARATERQPEENTKVSRGA